MSNDEQPTINVKGLDQLLKALKAKPPTARIGILSGSAPRTSAEAKNPSNAEIGAVHEFGSIKRNIPSRSFLRVPLTELLNKRLESSGALDKDVMAAVIKSGTVTPWLTRIMVIAEGIVSDAFDSGGFGKWKKWKDPGYQNNTGMLLVDTQQLRNSITTEVK